MRRERITLLVMALVSPLVVVGMMSAGLDAGVLLATPSLLLVLPLLCGRYVGEDRIARIAARMRGSRSRPPRRGIPEPRTPRRPGPVLPRGGRLLATALAVRPPPAAGVLT